MKLIEPVHLFVFLLLLESTDVAALRAKTVRGLSLPPPPRSPAPRTPKDWNIGPPAPPTPRGPFFSAAPSLSPHPDPLALPSAAIPCYQEVHTDFICFPNILPSLLINLGVLVFQRCPPQLRGPGKGEGEGLEDRDRHIPGPLSPPGPPLYPTLGRPRECQPRDSRNSNDPIPDACLIPLFYFCIIFAFLKKEQNI